MNLKYLYRKYLRLKYLYLKYLHSNYFYLKYKFVRICKNKFKTILIEIVILKDDYHEKILMDTLIISSIFLKMTIIMEIF